MASDGPAAWVDVGPIEELAPGAHRVYELDGRFVAVYNVTGTLYAIEDLCTHDGNPLSDGPVEGTEVICSRHGARFCLRTGAALSPPAYEPVACFPVEVRGGRILIGTAGGAAR
jgi:3-phenylpropionate/trans-cinnamate dioxygenase ferredoxin subunit